MWGLGSALAGPDSDGDGLSDILSSMGVMVAVLGGGCGPSLSVTRERVEVGGSEEEAPLAGACASGAASAWGVVVGAHPTAVVGLREFPPVAPLGVAAVRSMELPVVAMLVAPVTPLVTVVGGTGALGMWVSRG